MKLKIEAIGGQGDGIARDNGQVVFVAHTLPGETVEAVGEPPHLDLKKVIDGSPDRVEPICQHFGTCGGCALQHWAQKSYLDWKRQKVVDAFAGEGLTPTIDDCVATAPSSRRRVTFTATGKGGEFAFGYKRRGSDEIIDSSVCPILHPSIESHLDTFKQLARSAIRGQEEIQLAVTTCNNGLDLDFRLPQDLPEGMLAGFVKAFSKTSFLRASSNGDILVEREKPVISFGKADVAIPPGAFLQAVPPIENKMGEFVCSHLMKKKRVADLFSGTGTFALRLAERSRVHAVENETAPLEALEGGARAPGLKPVTTEQRDLFEAPLTTKELSRFDGICLDPPRVGALEQARELAKSDVPSVAYVSCNPQTLARDSKVLTDAGYKIDRVVPLDQFLYSPHVEVVALFSKPTAKKPKSIFGRRI